MHTQDAHHAEYLAAASALHEQTPKPEPRRQDPAVGDFVSGITEGRRWSGHVEWVEGRRMCVNVGGGWVSVPVSHITH